MEVERGTGGGGAKMTDTVSLSRRTSPTTKGTDPGVIVPSSRALKAVEIESLPLNCSGRLSWVSPQKALFTHEYCSEEEPIRERIQDIFSQLAFSSSMRAPTGDDFENSSIPSRVSCDAIRTTTSLGRFIQSFLF